MISDPFNQFGVPAVRPDASAVAVQRFPTAHNTIGPAPTHAAQPVGGLLGTLLSAGNHMDNFVRSRMQSYDSDRMAKDALAAAPFALSALVGQPELAGAAEAAPEADLYANLPRVAQAGSALRDRTAASLFDVLHPPPSAAISNLQTTGFANLPMTAESVVLPASGAGRAGSTAAAVARAKQIVGPETLKRMAQDELARRGGTTAEASMASMEQVARRLASQQ